MDESAVAAICAVPPELQGADAERFFDLIVEMYGEGLSSLDELIPQIGQREPGLVSPATQFSDNLRTQGLDGRWPAIAEMLVSEGGTGAALVALRDQYSAAAGAGGDGAVGWESFRARNADFWSGWNGADWAAWRAAFAERLPAGLNGEVEPHLSYLDGLDPAGQLTYLRDSLGFAINEETLAYYQTVGAEAAEPEAAAPEAAEPEAAQSTADQGPEELATNMAHDAAEFISQNIEELAAEAGVSVEEAREILSDTDLMSEAMQKVSGG